METFIFDNVLAAKQGTLQKLSSSDWRLSVGFRAVNIDGQAVRPSLRFSLNPDSDEALSATVTYGEFFESEVAVSDWSFGEDMKYMQNFNFTLKFSSGAEGVYQQPLMLKLGE